MGTSSYGVNFGSGMTDCNTEKMENNKKVFGNEEEILPPKDYIQVPVSGLNVRFGGQRNHLD
jgi:hypothetical protein